MSSASRQFDIRSLIGIDFPMATCPSCGAIISGDPGVTGAEVHCPVCRLRWGVLPDNGVPDVLRMYHARGKAIEYFKMVDTLLPESDQIAHAKALAEGARQFESFKPMYALFLLISKARDFVHFTTWNISDGFLGAFAALATRIPVRGIVGAPMNERQQDVLDAFRSAVHRFEVSTVDSDHIWSEGSHQKLIVVDGLVAIDGSTNLSHQAWARAAEDKDHVRVVTELAEVRQLNNRLFAKHFRSQGIFDPFFIDDPVFVS